MAEGSSTWLRGQSACVQILTLTRAGQIILSLLTEFLLHKIGIMLSPSSQSYQEDFLNYSLAEYQKSYGKQRLLNYCNCYNLNEYMTPQ